VTVRLAVTATGERQVTDVVQLYVAAHDPPVARPPKELVAWRKVVVGPGESVEIAVELGPSAFRRWNEAAGEWTADPATTQSSSSPPPPLTSASGCPSASADPLVSLLDAASAADVGRVEAVRQRRDHDGGGHLGKEMVAR
jgi:hypothetical protein